MNRIRELREEKNLTMKEVAVLLKLPYTTYVNYEKGAREPNSEVLCALADFYDTSVDYLLGKSIKKNTVSTTDPTNRYPYLLGKQLNGTISPEEEEELAALQRLNTIAGYFQTLTEKGQKEAVKRAGELAQLSEYRKRARD